MSILNRKMKKWMKKAYIIVYTLVNEKCLRTKKLMRIQELSEKTGISKRNIHFYIKEKLLDPKVNETNGYFDFIEEDVQKLMLIKNLREAGFSISMIRSMFHRPTTAEYYMRMRLGKIQQEIRELQKIGQGLGCVLEKMPTNPNFYDLHELVVKREFVNENEREESYDGMLVNHFLWRTFWESEELTEYQQFLWEKINKMTDQREKNIHYANLYDYLSSQDHKKIDTLYKERNQHFNRIAAFTEAEIRAYVEEMKESVAIFIHTPAAVAQWKEHYHTFICPQMKIFTGKIGEMAEEMSPFFGAYKRNSTKACYIVYEWLNSKEGENLKEEILKILEGYVNLEYCNHAELESMNIIFEY